MRSANSATRDVFRSDKQEFYVKTLVQFFIPEIYQTTISVRNLAYFFAIDLKMCKNDAFLSKKHEFDVQKLIRYFSPEIFQTIGIVCNLNVGYLW